MLDPKLFARIDDLYRRRDGLKLDDEQRRILELQHQWFVRAGAKLGVRAKKRVAEINGDLPRSPRSSCRTCSPTSSPGGSCWMTSRPRRPSPALRAAAARAARRSRPRRQACHHAVALERSSRSYSSPARRDLREKAFKAWVKRGENGGATDNRAIVAEIVALRAEWARLLGYKNYAEYTLDDTMAKTPDGGRRTARRRSGRRRVARAPRGARRAAGAGARRRAATSRIAPWDWRYYAEKVRKAALRSRRGGDQALPAARQRSSRPPSTRRRGCSGCSFKELQRRAALSPGRARLGGDGRDGQHVGAVPRRLFRAAVEALAAPG